MSEKKLRRLPLAAAAMVACMSAQADYTSPDGKFSMSGFGTVGLAKSSTNDAGFNYPGQGGGAGTSPSTNPDSKVAVQGTYKFAPTVSATTQVLTKYNASASYEPTIEWAFAKWQALPALTLRAGRIGAPFFMVSDFRDVGYANTTARPSLDVYGQVPVSQFEGLDASYQLGMGAVTLTSTLWAGDSHASYALANPAVRDPSDVSIKHNVGLNFVAEIDGGFTVRLGRSQGKLSVSSSTSAAIIQSAQQFTASALPAQYKVGFQSAIDMLSAEGVKASFTGIGLGYDQDNWVASLEYTKRKTDTYISDTTGWYATVGYRVGKFTPYVGYSKLKTDERAANPLSVLPGAFGPTNVTNSTLLKAGLEQVLNTQKVDQHTSTVGVRWDALSGVAIKAQWDQIHKPADAQGLFFEPSAASNFVAEKRKVNVLTLSVDFVF
jgi:hypothetical protein